ncbi:hypothetical protein ACRYI5_01120 [Furfurilactobacillus sp. WILCCON 0119]
MTFDEIKWPGPTISHLIASNDGINWDELKQYDFGWRDPSLAQFDGCWYVIYTGGIVRTKDWEQFDQLSYPIDKPGCMTWAPEWVNDNSGWHIIYAQTPPNGTEQDFDLYVVDFDPDTGSIDMTTSEKVVANYVKGSPIDPNVTVVNDHYYLWVRERDLVIRLYRSDTLSGPYTPVDTNFPDVQSGLNDEGPEMILIDGQWVLYSDPWAGWIPKRRLYYSTAINNDLTNWSALKPIEGLNYMPRHFGLIKQWAVKEMSITSVRDLKWTMNNNLNLFTQRLQELLNQFNYEYDDTLVVSPISELTSNSLDRKLYLELQNMFAPINADLLLLTDVLRQHKVKDDDGNVYVAPQLMTPTGLTIDDNYIKLLNDNWRGAFNSLSLYQEAFKKNLL